MVHFFAAIQHKYNDWKEFLVKRLTGARTLPQNFYNKVQENITEHPIKQGMKLEVVDKMCVSAMRVATVDEIKGGRLHLLYVDNKQPVSEKVFGLKYYRQVSPPSALAIICKLLDRLP